MAACRKHGGGGVWLKSENIQRNEAARNNQPA
jgi:hypothetical protein